MGYNGSRTFQYYHFPSLNAAISISARSSRSDKNGKLFSIFHLICESTELIHHSMAQTESKTQQSRPVYKKEVNPLNVSRKRSA